MVKLLQAEQKELIREYLSTDLEELKYLKLSWTLGENSMEENVKSTAILFVIVTLNFNVVRFIQNEWAQGALLFVFFFLLLFVVNGVRRIYSTHSAVKKNIELLDYCIEAKNNDKEKEALALLNKYD